MKMRLASLLSVALLLVVSAVAATPEKVTFVLQQDMRASIDPGDFQRGMESLAGYLPGGQIEIQSFAINDVKPVYGGPLDKMAWPPAGFAFTVANSATTPYKNLLKYLKDGQVADRTVYFVTTGIDNEGFHFMESSGVPSDYPLLQQLVKYCKDNKVVVNVFYVKVAPRDRRAGLAMDTLNYLAASSKGKIYYNYTTFVGIFKSVFGK